jgi:hypothetical protein
MTRGVCAHRYFGLPVPSEPLKSGQRGEIVSTRNLTEWMKDKGGNWSELAKKHGLDQSAFEGASFDFVDFATARTWVSFFGKTSACWMESWVPDRMRSVFQEDKASLEKVTTFVPPPVTFFSGITSG